MIKYALKLYCKSAVPDTVLSRFAERLRRCIVVLLKIWYGCYRFGSRVTLDVTGLSNHKLRALFEEALSGC